MKEIICLDCGKKSYSAARPEDLRDKRCPYCGAEPGKERKL